MRYTELICFTLILCLCSYSVSSSLSGIYKIDKRICEIKQKSDSLFFISESFKDLCSCQNTGCQSAASKKGFRSFEEWEAVNRSLWKLEDIEWKVCETDCGEELKESLYYGCWNGPYGKGEVYVRNTNVKKELENESEK